MFSFISAVSVMEASDQQPLFWRTDQRNSYFDGSLEKYASAGVVCQCSGSYDSFYVVKSGGFAVFSALHSGSCGCYPLSYFAFTGAAGAG